VSYSKEHVLAMEKAGWVLNPATGKFVKDEPAATVLKNGDVVEPGDYSQPPVEARHRDRSYQPAFHDNAKIREQPRQEPIANRPRNLYMELMQEEKNKREELARREAAKHEMQFMSKDARRQFVNNEGLNSRLTLEEQHQLHKQMLLHQQKKQELQQQQQASIRTFGGARYTLLKTIGEMSPAEKAEFVSLLGLNSGGVSNVHK
jgi:hypothetical protein